MQSSPVNLFRWLRMLHTTLTTTLKLSNFTKARQGPFQSRCLEKELHNTQDFFLINWLNRHETIRLEKRPLQSSLLTSKSILGRNQRLSGSQFSASLVKRHCRKYKIIESLHSQTIIKQTSKGERTLLSSLPFVTQTNSRRSQESRRTRDKLRRHNRQNN